MKIIDLSKTIEYTTGDPFFMKVKITHKSYKSTKWLIPTKNTNILLFFSCILLGILLSFIPPLKFLSEQKKYERVKNAYKEKGAKIETTLKNNNLNLSKLNILIVAYKEERLLEVYAKNKAAVSYKKIGEYAICATSGTLGPKREQGDGQVPEGFYYISRFNPASSYYLSLGLNYPNVSDKRKSTASNLGGDIFIHGECVTIGCMPMTNDKIKEIYIYAIQAHQNGQEQIPVYVFPFRLSNENIAKHGSYYKSNPELLAFWKNLKTGYDTFTKELKELKITTDRSGNYIF